MPSLQNRLYHVVTPENSTTYNGSFARACDTWKAIALRGNVATFSDVRGGPGGIQYKELVVQLVGWAVNPRGNLELLTASGWTIEITDGTQE